MGHSTSVRTTTNMKAFIALCFLAVVAAEPWGYGYGRGWGGRSYGGWGGRSYGSYGGRGYYRGKREAEAEPQVLLNSGLSTIYPSTIYSGINTYPTTYTSGLFNTGLFNTGLYSTGLTHIVKREADAEAYGYRSYSGWNNGNAGRWGGWGYSGRGYYGNRGYSGWGRGYGRRWSYGRW